MGADSRQPVGAYGLRLENVERARPLLVPAAADWPRLRIRRKLGTSEAAFEWMTERAATLKLQNGGEIVVDRGEGQALFVLPHRVRTPELVHPLLAPVAAVMAYWLERESFHASAFVAGGKAWGLIGERGSGKSSTVARLALDGVGIVSDDMLVLDGLRAFAAPRSVDLRGDAAAELDAGEALGVVGARERWRLPVGPVQDAIEIGGWFFLTWGDRVEAAPMRGPERFTRLHGNRGAQLPPRNVDALLELASLPGWELRRPRRWTSLPHAVDCLLQTAG
jgi:hypothetical protein